MGGRKLGQNQITVVHQAV